MEITDVVSMVHKFIGGTDPRVVPMRDAVVEYVATTGVPVVHAVWQLYGRTKGKPCLCTPCSEAPLTGEVVLRILVQKGGE